MADTYTFGPFELDLTRRRLRRGGEEIALTPKAFDILVVLTRNGGRVVEKATLIDAVWPDTIVDEGNLAFQISTLRKAIGDGDRTIVTVPGRGYQLAVAVQTAQAREVLIEERTTVTIAADPRRLIAAAVLLFIVAAAAVFLLRRPASQPSEAVRSLAVLPFKPIIASQRDEALEIGMADTLIARISRLREIVVRPLTAVRRFGGLEQDPIAAGRQLDVDAVLDGSIESANGRIRLNARLLRVADGRQIWQQTFDEPAGDLFALQDSLSVRLADALSTRLSPQQQQQVRKRDTENVEAYRAYAIARVHYLRVRSDEWEKAVEQLKRSIALDPNYAQAWALLGEIYARFPISSDKPPRPNFDLALDAAQRAIAIDPQLAHPWAVRGMVDFWYRWDWRSSEDAFRHAIALDPNDAQAHIIYAHLLSNTGRIEEARREADVALQLEPTSSIANALAGQFAMQAGDYQGGIRQLTHTLEIDPTSWAAHLNLGKIYELQGRYDEALAELEKARQDSGTSVEPLSLIAHLQAVRGNRAAAEAMIGEMRDIAKQRYVPPAKIALPYAALGDRDQAIALLRQACADRDLNLVFLHVNPRWDVMRSDPRFAEIERCVGLPR